MVSSDVNLVWPLLFHLVSHNPRTLMYFLISLATCADLAVSYRVQMFHVPILVVALVVKGFVSEMASRRLAPVRVIDSSREEFSRPGICRLVCCSFCSCEGFYGVELLAPHPILLLYPGLGPAEYHWVFQAKFEEEMNPSTNYWRTRPSLDLQEDHHRRLVAAHQVWQGPYWAVRTQNHIPINQ
jgi:hypothetical protein